MKKLIKILLYFFATILGLLIAIIIFLNIYYSVLESRYSKSASGKKTESAALTVTGDTVSTSKRDAALNLIPVPKKVNLTEGSYTLPQKIIFSVSDPLKAEAGKFLKTLLSAESICSSAGANMVFVRNEQLPVQGYILKIAPGRVTIDYSNLQGMWYHPSGVSPFPPSS
jgi:hypothetical protein